MDHGVLILLVAWKSKIRFELMLHFMVHLCKYVLGLVESRLVSSQVPEPWLRCEHVW